MAERPAQPAEQRSTGRVRLFGPANSAEAYRIRDFLKRSVVDFDWVELKTDADARQHTDCESLDDPGLPLCELPDGTRLRCPSLESLAARLGWVGAPRHTEYDVSIYGAGPAGLSAAVYAASEGLKTALIERDAIGGQAGSSSLIENYMGFADGISGADLAERARQQAVKFGADILQMREGVNAVFENGRIHADLADGNRLVARANICATGIEYRQLALENERRFLGRGLYYGAGFSEAPMCAGQTVYVVGGGNSAGQAAMNLSEFATRVVMLVRGAALSDTLSHYLIEKIAKTPNIEVLTGARLVALRGGETLEEIVIANTGGERAVPTARVFVCIGGQPNTDWAKGTAIVRDVSGYLRTGPDLTAEDLKASAWALQRAPFYLETSVPGSFAVGDVRHGSVKRVAAAVGEGAMAVTFVHRHLS